MKARAPGKLILSGEHSVVYGAPALALAVDEHVTACFSPALSTSSTESEHLSGFNQSTSPLAVSIGQSAPLALAVDQLAQLPLRLDQAFNQYLAGDCAIDAISSSPEELVFYALLQIGAFSGQVNTQSTLPTGAGMGSSAAAIAASLRLAEQVLQQAPMSASKLLTCVAHCERLQHGRGSIIDASAVSYGGVVEVKNGQAKPRNLHLPKGLFRIFSGTPSVSTGHCVDQVRAGFGSSAIWSEFAEVTEQFGQCLQANEQAVTTTPLIESIKANHQLLMTIGVVPAKVVDFIAELEALGGAAKISGAGATEGIYGGMLLAYGEEADLINLAVQYGYSISALGMDTQGAKALSS